MSIIFTTVAVVISGIAVYYIRKRSKHKTPSSEPKNISSESFSFDDFSEDEVTDNNQKENKPVVVKLRGRNFWTENKSSILGFIIMLCIVIAVAALSFITNKVHDDKALVIKMEDSIKTEREDSLQKAEKEFFLQQTKQIGLDVDSIKKNTTTISNRISKTKRKEK